MDDRIEFASNESEFGKTIAVIVVGRQDVVIYSQRLRQIQELLSAFGSDRFALCGVVGKLAYIESNGSDLATPAYDSINAAIDATNNSHLVLADIDASFSRPFLTILDSLPQDRLELLTEKSAVHMGLAARILMALVALVTWVLLGNRKTQFSAGALFGSGQYLANTSVPDVRSLSEWVAALRADGSDILTSSITGSCCEVANVTLRASRAELTTKIRFWWGRLKFPVESSLVLESESGVERKRFWLSIAFLAIICWFVLARGLDYPLFEPDESRNAQLALNICETGDWVALQLNNEPYWDKPPLAAWLTATSYKLFGVSETTTRLPGNLSAIVNVLLAFVVGRNLLGMRAAWIGALGLLLSVGFVACGRYVTMDSLLTSLSTATLFFAYFAARGQRFRWGWWVGSAVAGGLGLLAKGPVVVAVTLPVLLLEHFLRGNRMLLDMRRWAVYVGVVVAVAGPWYFAMGLVYPGFLHYFFWKHHVMRFSEAFNHHEPWWYYGPVLLLAMFPASYLLPSVANWLWSNREESRENRTREIGLLALFAGWVLVLFSLSEAKLPTYILPAFPALALLIGALVDRRLIEQTSQVELRKWWPSIPVHASRMLFVLLAVAVGVSLYRSFPVVAWPVVWGGLVLAVGTLLMLVAHDRLAPMGANWLGVSLLGIITVALLFQRVVPVVSESRSIYVAARQLSAQTEFAELPVVFYEHEDYGSTFWFQDRNTVSFDDDDRHLMTEFLEKNRSSLIVSRQTNIDILSRTLKWPLAITPVVGARRLYLCTERESESLAPKEARRLWNDEVLLRR